MRVYIAAPYVMRDHLRPLAEELRSLGFATTATWLGEDTVISEGTIGAATEQTQAQVNAHVVQDVSDINRSDVVVMFTAWACLDFGAFPSDALLTGGRHVEVGMALAKGKRVIVIGDPENVFHRGACRCVPDWHAAVLALVELRERTTERRSLTDTAGEVSTHG